MSPPVPADRHQPVWILNLTGDGLRGYYGCACGDMPRRIPALPVARAEWYHQHRRTLRLRYMHSLAHAVYGPRHAAAGMTWQEWNAENPGVDPFTGEADHPPPRDGNGRAG